MTFQEQLQLKVMAVQSLGPAATQAQVEERFIWLAQNALDETYNKGYKDALLNMDQVANQEGNPI